MSLILNTNL